MTDLATRSRAGTAWRSFTTNQREGILAMSTTISIPADDPTPELDADTEHERRLAEKQSYFFHCLAGVEELAQEYAAMRGEFFSGETAHRLTDALHTLRLAVEAVAAD
jgi:hypothetical protein